MREENVKIRDIFRILHIDPELCVTEKENEWIFHRGNTSIYLIVKEGKNYKAIASPIVIFASRLIFLPVQRENKASLMLYLLEQSHLLVHESFSIALESNGAEAVYFSSTFNLNENSARYLADCLDNFSYYAMKYDQILEEKMKKDNTEKTIKPFILED